MDIHLTVAETTNGAGKKKKPELEEILCTNFVSYKKVKTLREFCRTMPCIVPCDEDNFCFIRSCLLGKLIHENKTEFKKRSIPGDIEFTNKVKMYAKANGLVDHPYGLNIQDVKAIEAKLGYQIVIYQNAEKTPMHWEHRYDELPKIYILYNSEVHHFSLIKHIRAFFENKYFCEKCMKIYSTINAHRCPATCSSCFRMNCEEATVEACMCGVKLNNQRCSFNHAQVCKIARRCPTCTNIMPYKRKHVCYDQKYCSNCEEVVELDHRCYIKKLARDSKVKFKGVGFFDFETYESENGTHVVNLVIAKRYCKECYYNDEQMCKLSDKNYMFYNISDFVSWLKAHANKSFIWYAHNSRLNELYKTALPTDPQINVITNGTKIMELKCAGFIIRDSACFIPMPLAQFPAAFGIREMKKGYFPYKFCKPENFNYVGPYPDASYYQPEFMT
jgi:hypothetical protein